MADLQRSADAAMLLVALEDDRDPGGEANPARDQLCVLWIGRAPRFGAVAAHFPVSLRTKRSDQFPSRPTPWTGFVASFWAPEVLLLGDLYLRRFTRMLVDQWVSDQINRARRVPPGRGRIGGDRAQPFWSPEMPEVLPFDGEGTARAAAGGWRDVCVFVDPVGHRRIAHRVPPRPVSATEGGAR